MKERGLSTLYMYLSVNCVLSSVLNVCWWNCSVSMGTCLIMDDICSVYLYCLVSGVPCRFLLDSVYDVYTQCMIEGWCSMRVLTVQKGHCLSCRSLS